MRIVKWLSPCVVLIGSAGSAGCDSKTAEFNVTTPTAPGEAPATVKVAGGQVTEGFRFGKLRKSQAVRAQAVMRHPVTVGEFKACVSAGACPAPTSNCFARGSIPVDGPTADGSRDVSDQTPATCVGLQQAGAFCRWHGGRLPTLAEWLNATRGSEVQRYPWGETVPDCERHPKASAACGPQSTEDDPKASARKYEVGGHPSGASASGVSDVLLTAGELVARSDGSVFGACDAPNRGCIVHGVTPGAIDSVEPLRREAHKARTVYGFRCVWDE